MFLHSSTKQIQLAYSIKLQMAVEVEEDKNLIG